MNKVLLSFLTLMLVSCFSSGGGGIAAITGTLSDFGNEAFPGDFAVASPTVAAATLRVTGVSSPSTLDSKLKALKAMLASGASLADCEVDLTITNPVNATCYGPTAAYTNHEVGGGAGSLPGGDLGIWQASETSTGEACSAAQLNNRVSGAASYVDVGTLTAAALLCVAEAEGESLPEIGNTLDLTAAAAGVISIQGVDVSLTSATITRNADMSGNAVYVSAVTGTLSTTTVEVRLIHTNTAEDKSSYLGKVSVAIRRDNSDKPQNCSGGTEDGYTDATSVAYEKTSSTNLIYEMKSANFCGNDGDPYTASSTNYTVDLTEKFDPGTKLKGWANNANYLLASYNPSLGSGQFAYAWQAGMGDGYSRVFNVKATALAASTAATSFFGFGPDLALETNMGSISGMICNWAGPAPNKVLDTNFVQKQTMLSSSGGIFSALSSDITYDPVNTCESSSATFALSGNSGVAFNYTMDTTTKDLAAFSDIATDFGTLPTVPTEIDPVCLVGCH